MNQLQTTEKQLMMFRFTAPAPAVPLPDGWTVRPMKPGEGGEWVRIARTAGFIQDDGQDPEALWMAEMGSDPFVKAENVFFTCNASGRPVATATARLVPEERLGDYPAVKGGFGYLHYVAALPEYRGIGAGSAVTTQAIRRFQDLGFGGCVLVTDDFRLPAIRSYLRLGWLPVLHAPDMPARWEKVLAELGYSGEAPALDASLNSIALRPPID